MEPSACLKLDADSQISYLACRSTSQSSASAVQARQPAGSPNLAMQLFCAAAVGASGLSFDQPRNKQHLGENTVWSSDRRRARVTVDLQRIVVEFDSGVVGHAVILYHSAISKLRSVPATLCRSCRYVW